MNIAWPWLMRQDGIRAKTREKWRATTQSHHRFPLGPDEHPQSPVHSRVSNW